LIDWIECLDTICFKLLDRAKWFGFEMAAETGWWRRRRWWWWWWWWWVLNGCM